MKIKIKIVYLKLDTHDLANTMSKSARVKLIEIPNLVHSVTIFPDTTKPYPAFRATWQIAYGRFRNTYEGAGGSKTDAKENGAILALEELQHVMRSYTADKTPDDNPSLLERIRIMDNKINEQQAELQALRARLDSFQARVFGSVEPSQ